MTYLQTLDYLYRKLPMFTRVGAVAYKKDLHNTVLMCDRLGNPQNKFKSIHIAGTNGKGSTSHMLAAILQKAGYKTGLYTSPHLKDFRERIKVNGEMASKDFVISFVEQQEQIIEEISPSFFEVTVAMAFEYFVAQAVDVAVIEVGLGGTLDSTNIITPELSIITNISLDHTALLGNTLAAIASQKAGIIKRGVPVVIGERNEETQEVFVEKAKESDSAITFAEDTLELREIEWKNNFLISSVYRNNQLLFENVKLDLTGSYQLKNVITVIEAVSELAKVGFPVSDEAIYNGLSNVKGITGLQGRWQILDMKPLTICDTGHNEAGIKEVIKNIERSSFKTLRMVIGMVKDKDIQGVLSLLPKDAVYYFCSPDLERALPSPELAAMAVKNNLQGRHFNTVKEAVQKAREEADCNDLVFIGGSTFVVAEVL